MMANSGFTNEDFLNLILIHGECNKVVERTCRMFRERFPDKPRPTKDIVNRLLHNCKTHGKFRNPSMKMKPLLNNENVEITVLAFFQIHPEASLRQAERELGYSRNSMQRILRKHKWHPFSLQLVQHLKPEDLRRRVEFCEFILVKVGEDSNFLENIIWSDESKFCKNGMFNRHNHHQWSDQNPHAIRERNFQESWSFNVYCCIKNDKILKTFLYDRNLDGAMYVEILNNVVVDAVDDMPLCESLKAWYQHDGAPPHNVREVNMVLTDTFNDRWLAYNGPFEWPPRSPDLTPLDYFVWGYVKSQVYSTPLTTKENAKERVRVAFASISASKIRKATNDEFLRRVNKCLAVDGGVFEHLK